MRLKGYSIIMVLVLGMYARGQYHVTGTVKDGVEQQPLAGVALYGSSGRLLATTNVAGAFKFETLQDSLTIIFYSPNYQLQEISLKLPALPIDILLQPLTEQLTAVEIIARKKKIVPVAQA